MKSDPIERHLRAAPSQPEAAVGIISCSLPEEAILLLKRVHNDMDPWSGHYAFPGGRRENGDRSIFDTCIREVFEETRISLGQDDLHRVCEPAQAGRNVQVPVVVQPYVFKLESCPRVTVERKEIDSHLWLPVDSFRRLENHRFVEIRPGMQRPVFPINDYYIWGFTYGLLCRLLDVDSAAIGRKTGTDRVL